MFANAANGQNVAVLEGSGDFRRGRFENFWFLAQPDGFDDIAGDPLGKAAGNGFNFREFGHVSAV
jgi:hypothetical protein